MKKEILHLKNDPVLCGLILKYGERRFENYWSKGGGNPFLDLVGIVFGQQLSMKAADTIWERFKKLYKKDPLPDDIMSTSEVALREVGLSRSKAQYVKNISAFWLESADFVADLDSLADEEIAKRLITIKGVGNWTIEMFLMFSLKRPDVFSIGDLGLRNAVSRLYGVDREDYKKILKISKNWSPYRTLASRYLWLSLEGV